MELERQENVVVIGHQVGIPVVLATPVIKRFLLPGYSPLSVSNAITIHALYLPIIAQLCVFSSSSTG